MCLVLWQVTGAYVNWSPGIGMSLSWSILLCCIGLLSLRSLRSILLCCIESLSLWSSWSTLLLRVVLIERFRSFEPVPVGSETVLGGNTFELEPVSIGITLPFKLVSVETIFSLNFSGFNRRIYYLMR